MANQIRLKRASGSDPGASDLVTGELAVRTDNGKLFTKKDDNSVTEIGVTPVADGSITSAKIADGAIVNADVNASAAIAGTKISPDFGSQNIETTGVVEVGGDNTQFGNNLLRFKSSGDGFIDHNTTGQDIKFRVSNSSSLDTTPLTLNSDGHVDVAGNLDVGAGVDVTGNIAVSGTVDGRDVATDGTKLDGIASGATNVTNTNQLTNGAGFITATLTNEQVQDIVGGMVTGNTESGITVTYQDGDGTLDFSVASQTDNNFTNADHSKLDGIESGATADQSASEIVALVADQTIAPSEIDMEDNEKIKLGAGDDLQIYHDGSNSYLSDAGTGNFKITTDGAGIDIDKGSSEHMARFKIDAEVELYYNNTLCFETTSSGVEVHGNLQMDDNRVAYFGTGGDMEIFHDGSSSFVRDVGTGSLKITSDGTGIDLQKGSSETLARFIVDGAVELYHNNSKKIETTSAGTAFTGNATSAVSSLTDGSNIAVDLSSGTHFTVTLGGNRTFTNSGMNTSSSIGSSGSIFIVQDGTGSRTAAFQSTYKFAGGTAPTLSTAANAVDRLDYIVRAADNVHCVVTLDVK